MSNTVFALVIVFGLIVDGVVVACVTILVEDACEGGYVYVVAANAGLTMPSIATVATIEVIIFFINS
jgi:hypothetical protein